MRLTVEEALVSTSAARIPLWPGRARRRDEHAPVVADSWDDVPSGPVPAEVLRYFEEAIAREEERARVRAAHTEIPG